MIHKELFRPRTAFRGQLLPKKCDIEEECYSTPGLMNFLIMLLRQNCSSQFCMEITKVGFSVFYFNIFFILIAAGSLGFYVRRSPGPLQMFERNVT